ncbi:RNA-binding domain-containing protein [Phlebopus sp. FC_14]|nr:RNA-binding domain-containing protein [Phlebopus sp. FC_14]
MFIGGLNWDTTDDSLRNYFSQFGKVDACTIMRDAAGRSRCFAFLTFEDPASVNAVMVREHFLDGKIIDPKRAIPRQEHQRATKLFIGGLAGSVTSESMREFFSQFGKVIDSTVMLDRETGRSKGFGFVSFEDTNVQPFLGFGNLEIDGKLIDVKLAQPRHQRDQFQEDGPQYGVRGGGGGGGGGGYNAAPMGGNFGGGAGGVVGGGGVGLPAGPMGNAPASNTPFDPQALAALYTRMFQIAGGGGMMGMNPMMGGMGGGFGAGMGAMGRGMGGAMGAGAGMGGMGAGMGGPMGGAMGGGAQGAGGPNGLGPNVPRGPRGQQGGPAGPAGGAGVGPQRAGQRGQHSYHPYAR